MRHTGWLSIVSMLVAATVAAQDKPDLSGRWVLAGSTAAGPDVARSLTVRQSIVRTTFDGAPMDSVFGKLTVERQFVSDVRTDIYQIGISGGTVGGVVPTGRGTDLNLNIPEWRFSVGWEGNRLVIERRNYSGPTREVGPYTEHVEVWQLDARGMLILSVTDRGSGIESTTNVLRYMKTRERRHDPPRSPLCAATIEYR